MTERKMPFFLLSPISMCLPADILPDGPGGCAPRAPIDPYVDTLDHTVPQV